MPAKAKIASRAPPERVPRRRKSSPPDFDPDFGFVWWIAKAARLIRHRRDVQGGDLALLRRAVLAQGRSQRAVAGILDQAISSQAMQSFPNLRNLVDPVPQEQKETGSPRKLPVSSSHAQITPAWCCAIR
jgi:hypothetical protein